VLAPSWTLRDRIGAIVFVVVAVGVAVTYVVAPLNPNLRYEAGAKEVTGSAAGSFSHRPLGYRLLTDVIFRVARLAGAEVVTFELAVRVLLALLAAGAAVLLWRALVRRGLRHAGGYALVCAGTLALFGDVSAGEPEWLAALLTMAGVGVALIGRRRPWLFAGLAGLLLVAAAGMKLITLVTALLGLLVIGLFDRRQAVRTIVASLVIGLLFVGATLRWVPWEVQWLLDIRSVQNSARDELSEALPYFADLAARRPVLVLIPAALILAAARERVLIAGSVAITAATILIQGQYFQYHAIDLVTVAAIAAFRALRGRVTALVGIVVLVVAAAASALSSVNSDWIYDHQRWWAGALLAVALLAAGWAISRRCRPGPSARDSARGRSGGLLAALATLALILPGATPWSSHLWRPENPDGSRPPTTLESRDLGQATAAQVHGTVGESEVTYLTSGEWPYFIGNPTRCRYPSPLFLQRTLKPARLHTASYAENLACLGAPGSRWLIIEWRWFIVGKQPATVQAVLEREWDCAEPVETGELRLCPRRAGRP
jgi:hypothetical protein